jgi:hypothetical protein
MSTLENMLKLKVAMGVIHRLDVAQEKTKYILQKGLKKGYELHNCGKS